VTDAQPPTGPLPVATRSRTFIDLRPLRESPAFARLWFGNTVTGIGSQMTIVAVGLHIYQLTQSTLAVSLVAAFTLLPMIVAGLYGGMLADAFDRRTVSLVAAVAAWGSAAALAAITWAGVYEVWPLYALSTVSAVASTIVGVAKQAIIPRLVRPELLPAAGALGGITAGIMLTVGPALAGVLVAGAGIAWTYTADAVLYLGAFLGLYTLPRILPEGERHRPGLRSVVDGWRFLRHAPNIRASFVLDLFAMGFGHTRVLFPAVGAVLLGGGAVTVGVLSSATAVGVLLMGLLSGRLGAVRMQGRAIAQGVMAYGAAITGFAVTLLVASSDPSDDVVNLPALLIASAFLALAGAADNVSMIFRNTMLQSAVPDAMRGRLQGLFIVVVTGGPRLGDLYVGVLAVGALLWFPPLIGGVVIVVAAALILRIQRTLRHYDAHDPSP